MSNVFQTCLKGFKLKKLVVEQKMAQPVEPDEEPVDPSTQPVEECKKSSLSSRMVVQLVKVWTLTGWDPTVTCQPLNANS